jgi:hypothetical protein
MVTRKNDHDDTPLEWMEERADFETIIQEQKSRSKNGKEKRSSP